MNCFSEEKRSVTSADEEAESSDAADDDDSQRGSVERLSPQLDVSGDTDVISEVLSAGELTQHRLEPTDGGDSSSELDMHAVCSPDPVAKSADSGGQAVDGLRPTVGASPPPLPSPPSLTTAVSVTDDDATAALVITDVAKYVSKQTDLMCIE